MISRPFKTSLFIAALSLVAIQARAQVPHVYDFLRSGASARAAAMGGTFLTVPNDPTGLYYNPALLKSIDTTQAAFTFFKHLLDINSGTVTVATDVESIGKVGFGVSYVNYGSF